MSITWAKKNKEINRNNKLRRQRNMQVRNRKNQQEEMANIISSTSKKLKNWSILSMWQKRRKYSITWRIQIILILAILVFPNLSLVSPIMSEMSFHSIKFNAWKIGQERTKPHKMLTKLRLVMSSLTVTYLKRLTMILFNSFTK